ncbi:Leader peptidase PppA [Caulifigura coniformis]|uniref:Leader peptidase PppA n=1 Tax=Caulifigura coniformis TaxID=2527983 RepID=A0A517S7D4_9PLAN|nr:A24 family peptidase [Caulifigura coniformis]QDT52015.1 Leader peptidase PppA [Caulifigura coniformis]
MIHLDLPAWVIYPTLFLFGSIIGSFLNVCIYRIPQKDGFWESLQELWNRPSQCKRCRSHIRWQHNIPIFGWLMLGGRCADCRAWISPRYPLIEFLNASLFVLVYWFEIGAGDVNALKDSCLYTQIGPEVIPGLGSMSPTMFAHLRYAFHMVLIEALLVATFIDFDLWIIPDGVTLPAMVVGFVGNTLIGRVHLVPVWVEQASLFAGTPPDVPAWFSHWPHLHGFLVAAAGFVIGGGIVWTVRVLGHWALKQEAMGFGDVILLAMIGSFVGWQASVIVFFLAPVIAIVVVLARLIFHRDRAIPYGPYLSIATLVSLLFWAPVWDLSERVLSLGPLLIPLALISVALLASLLFVARLIRLALGIMPIDDQEELVWTAADQNFLYSGEKVDRFQGQWKTNHDWSGVAASRGTMGQERWRGR